MINESDRTFVVDEFRKYRATGFSEAAARERVRQFNPVQWAGSGFAGATLQAIANEAERVVIEQDRPYAANRNESRHAIVNVKMAGGLSYDEAWQAASRENPALFNTVSAGAPKGVKVSHDGQELITGEKPTPAQLQALGLPMVATADEVRIYRAAQQAELTPEVAALVVRWNVEEGQLEGHSFDDEIANLQNHEPNLWALALKAKNESGGVMTDAELIAAGLPVGASSEVQKIWRAAAKLELTPAIVARVVRTSIQGIDKDAGGGSFPQVMERLKKHRPELYKLAMQAKPGDITPQKVRQ